MQMTELVTCQTPATMRDGVYEPPGQGHGQEGPLLRQPRQEPSNRFLAPTKARTQGLWEASSFFSLSSFNIPISDILEPS